MAPPAPAPAVPPVTVQTPLSAAALPVVAAVRGVRQLARQVGGLAALRELVEALAEADE